VEQGLSKWELDKKGGRNITSLFNKRWHSRPPFLSNEPGTGLKVVQCGPTYCTVHRSYRYRLGVISQQKMFSVCCSWLHVHCTVPVYNKMFGKILSCIKFLRVVVIYSEDLQKNIYKKNYRYGIPIKQNINKYRTYTWMAFWMPVQFAKMQLATVATS
jgi:hypothetical protein